MLTKVIRAVSQCSAANARIALEACETDPGLRPAPSRFPPRFDKLWLFINILTACFSEARKNDDLVSSQHSHHHPHFGCKRNCLHCSRLMRYVSFNYTGFCLVRGKRFLTVVSDCETPRQIPETLKVDCQVRKRSFAEIDEMSETFLPFSDTGHSLISGQYCA